MGKGQELLDAARNGDRRTVEKILGQITKRSGPFTTFSLKRGAGVNVQGDNGYTALHQACLNGHKDIARLLLSVGASPCMVEKNGATPLHLAAFKGDAEIVRLLLAHNNPPVNIDQLTSDHESAVLIAAQFGYVEVVAQLIEHGADVTIKNTREESALDLAAQYGRVDTVSYLLRVRPQLIDQYKPPTCRGQMFSSTPLHRASMNGLDGVVSALLAAGVDPNIRTQAGTALHEAACFGKPSVVRILLEKGADLHALDRRGKSVHALLREYSGDGSKRVRKVIEEYENRARAIESEDDAPFHGSSPTVMKAPETQKNTNKNNSLFSPSSSSLTKFHHPQSFVKKLASKCLGLKAKFNSAPNIPDSTRLESDVDAKSKNLENKSNTNTLHIGNSKFFKILSKKDESGDIVCNDEFDTISLDRLGTLNRDSVVNRSNRSCPGFKTSLPNISENNEMSDSLESVAESVVITELECDKNKGDSTHLNQAINYDANFNIFEPRANKSVSNSAAEESAVLVNECYESYEFSKQTVNSICQSLPKPPPRPTLVLESKGDEENIYENVVKEVKTAPRPAARTHIPSKKPSELENVKAQVALYENIPLKHERVIPEPPKRMIITQHPKADSFDDYDTSPSVSRSSTLSSDSMFDESNLEDILLSEKSKSFRHSKVSSAYTNTTKSNISRTRSNISDSSDVTQASAIENVDCSDDVESLSMAMTGTLPNKKSGNVGKKKVLFRHKTFTNIEVDRNSTRVKDLPQWNNQFLKDTLAHYHIRGTGHCIYKGPSIREFLNLFNRDTLSYDQLSSLESSKRDSYFETAICFCRPRPPKHHNSAEDLLEISPQEQEETVSIDTESLMNRREIVSTTFRCYCDLGTCTYHSKHRDKTIDYIVKFSAIKKSISTPDITLDSSPISTVQNTKLGLTKNKSTPHNFEEQSAIPDFEDILVKSTNIERNETTDSVSTNTSQPSTLSSTTSARPYSIKDIAEVISLNRSVSTTDSLKSASYSVHLPLRKSSSSEYSGWSLQSCNSNVTIKSDASFKTCFEESSDEDTDGTLHSDAESEAETVKSDISTGKRPWVHSDSFRFGNNNSKPEIDVIEEESAFEDSKLESLSSKFESGVSAEGSESTSSDDSGIPRVDGDVSLASLERGSGLGAGVRSGSGRRRWDDGASEPDALSVSSAASSCAPLHWAHHHDYNKVSPTPPKKPPRRNLSVSPTHANSPSSGYSYELRSHARSQDDLDDIQGAKHYLKHGRSVDQYVDSKLSFCEYEENHNPRIPVPNPRPSLKQRSQPVAITATYENIVIKEQNPRRKLRRNNLGPAHDNYERMNDRYRNSNQERSSLESLLDDSINSPSDCERYADGHRVGVPSSPTHYEQPPTPEHPPPSARQAENSIHERIRPLSQLIMEVVEEIRIRKKSQSDIIKHS